MECDQELNSEFWNRDTFTSSHFSIFMFSRLNFFNFFNIETDAIKSIIDTNDDGIASNWEYFIAMDPNNMDGNDYVWDHFNWDHCA